MLNKTPLHMLGILFARWMHWVCHSRYHKIITSLELFTFWTSRHELTRVSINANAARCKSSEILMRETFLRARFGLYVEKIARASACVQPNSPSALGEFINNDYNFIPRTHQWNCDHTSGSPRNPRDSTSLGFSRNENWKCLIRTLSLISVALNKHLFSG